MSEPIVIGDITVEENDPGVMVTWRGRHSTAYVFIPEVDRVTVAKALLPDNYIVLRCGPNRFTENSLVVDNTITDPIGIIWGGNDDDE